MYDPSLCSSPVIGMLPEFVAKWITGNGIPVSMLCMTQDPPPQTDESMEDSEDDEVRKVECLNPLVGESACVCVDVTFVSL